MCVSVCLKKRIPARIHAYIHPFTYMHEPTHHPITTQPMRFGNKAFRDWHARLVTRGEALVKELLGMSEARIYLFFK